MELYIQYKHIRELTKRTDILAGSDAQFGRFRIVRGGVRVDRVRGRIFKHLRQTLTEGNISLQKKLNMIIIKKTAGTRKSLANTSEEDNDAVNHESFSLFFPYS